MLAPLKWIREYVDIDVDAKEFSDMMTMTGSKVEAVEYLGEEIKNVVVGKILKIEAHPDADKLIVCQVDIGSEHIQIVTGAKNVCEGDYIPVATHGAILPGGMNIKKGKLRGEVSQGMMCSSNELGIPESMIEENKRDGIYIIDWEDKLSEEDILGKDIRDFLDINDAIVEFEITSNRPDCLSMVGIAREAAATLKIDMKYPEISVKESDENMKFGIKIEDADLCPRYAARIVKDVKVKASPYWMQRRLIEAGMRPINNIVDITNYVMLELGQPLHAFDLEKIEGENIIVRRAKEGETIVTLDDKERKLDCEMLLITDEKKSLAIAGIMGGANSEVDCDTKTLLIESANFAKAGIRATSKRIGLRSEASSRFEKGVDPNLVETALNRVAQLIEQTGSGTILRGYEDNYPNPVESKNIEVSVDRINKLLGDTIPGEEMAKMLKSLEFECTLNSDELSIKVPTFRLDMEHEADVLEEVARIYGYDNISSHMIHGITTMGLKTIGQLFEDSIKDMLTGAGVNEILTYSFVSPKGVKKINIGETSIKNNFMKLLNPLGEETSVMRTTLIPNMMEVISTNNSKKVERFAGFELGNTFMAVNEIIPIEKKAVCIGLYEEGADFFTLKGIVEALFEKLGIKGCEIIPEKNHTTFHSGRCANIVNGSYTLGTFGEIHPDVLENYDIKRRVYVAELDFELMLTFARDMKIYKPLPKYPAMSRDIALVVKEEVFVKQIEDIIRDNSQGLVESFKLFDVYRGEQVESGHKSVAYSLTYRSEEKTLTDEEVEKVHSVIVEKLESQLEAKLRD
ncbi:phenylalanyl-tRNA synthetase beta subunit [Peptoclostridium litorale DSM 5388]|uniref:Phenylalanine--tRNA ligase beta subunit n=1 Tax=Peptoclostridium litorale DSM 5388 TaxID=1121324 RepID=A0A069RG23_PEPLI|nr:phenylalanine--tRNA ligase subunit beta [Peptoclostridium litorale]KDR95994.1 phenylalanine--tRNA ligase beta subunit PheT [Peptoclostridium litorale DSM 5388]SIO07038.1 phenylalanyl-tRNA synthetase beta subunit [Peptoclostridium litorale DSM 5388]